jgi:hypothetical protein
MAAGCLFGPVFLARLKSEATQSGKMEDHAGR